jgi:hypothetical protein
MKNRERVTFIILAAACLALPGGAFAAPSETSLSPADLLAGTWSISPGYEAASALRFFPIDGRDSGQLYLRRFSTPSFYLDALAGEELKVLLWPEAKSRTLSFSADGSSFLRETSPAKLEYRRVQPLSGASPYEGDWTIGALGMEASIRACEKRVWSLVMYFPGSPESAIPLGYYPLVALGDGRYRSSGAFPDSLIELSYDEASGALLIRPLFKARPLATADLYDPVRAWRDK